MDCTLNFHFWVAVCLFFRSSAHAKRFTWKWLDFNKNVWTGDIHLVLHKDSCHRGKSQLAIGLFIHELTQGAFAFLLPLQVLNPLPFAYLLLTSLSSTPLHYEVQLRISPSKKQFYLTWLVNIRNNLHCNLLIHLFKACFTLHENIHGVAGEFSFLFVEFTWKWPRATKSKRTVSLTLRPFLSLCLRYLLKLSSVVPLKSKTSLTLCPCHVPVDMSSSIPFTHERYKQSFLIWRTLNLPTFSTRWARKDGHSKN